ncbi:hypothetical protein KQ871_15510, partial [Listeria monocytogenes]|nr:hypothetical protein [Listeria monocytogenes]
WRIDKPTRGSKQVIIMKHRQRKGELTMFPAHIGLINRSGEKRSTRRSRCRFFSPLYRIFTISGIDGSFL